MLFCEVKTVYKFDESVKNQVESILKQYNHNSELLSFNEVLMDNKLTTYLLKQNAAVQDVVFLYKQLIELKNISNLSGDESKTEKLKAQITQIEDEICVLLAKKDAKFENVTVEIVSKPEADRFAKFILDGMKVGCQNLSYSFSLNRKEYVFYAEICGFGALKTFLAYAGIHRAKVSGQQIDIAVYVYQTPAIQCFQVGDEDVKIDVFKSGGHGGQGVNTTDSAVRVTHLKTKISVVCQDERSQIQNKEKAILLLKEKLKQFAEKNASQIVYKEKKEQVKQIEHGFVCRFYDFDKKIITTKNGEVLESFEQFLDGKI